MKNLRVATKSRFGGINTSITWPYWLILSRLPAEGFGLALS
jgi:hypothetical protein